MANKQKQMLAVWGSPGGGKTVTAVKLALELSKRKKNVVLVFTDVTAPTLPAVVSEKKLPDVSVGELLAAPGMTQEQVLKTCVPCEKNPYISFLGYKAGENVFTHAEYSKEKAVDMLVLLRHIADYVIVDCTSLLTGNVLATTALEVADDVLRVCSCDLKAISTSRPICRWLLTESSNRNSTSRCCPTRAPIRAAANTRTPLAV